jgi:histidine triad (HIT) family protein
MSDDFYCEQVLSGRTPVKLVHETENVLAYHHTRPFWETHIVVIPKRHIPSLIALEEADREIFLELFDVIKKVAAQVTAEKGAARVLTNLGDYQESKHLHFHVNSGDQIREDGK